MTDRQTDRFSTCRLDPFCKKGSSEKVQKEKAPGPSWPSQTPTIQKRQQQKSKNIQWQFPFLPKNMNLRHNPQLLCEFAQIVTSHNRKLQGAQVDPEAPGAQTMNCNFAFRWLKLLGDHLIGGRFKIHIDMNSSEGWSCAPVKMHWAICILSPPRPALSP